MCSERSLWDSDQSFSLLLPDHQKCEKEKKDKHARRFPLELVLGSIVDDEEEDDEDEDEDEEDDDDDVAGVVFVGREEEVVEEGAFGLVFGTSLLTILIFVSSSYL